MNNVEFDQDFGDYLAANGYQRTQEGEGTAYTDRDKSVQIKNDKAVFYCWYDGSYDEEPCFSQYASVSGLGQLDFVKWVLLMHIYDIVPLNRFMKAAKVNVGDLFEQIAAIVKPVEYPTFREEMIGR